MKKPVKAEARDDEADRAYIVEQMKISLAQIRAGYGLSAEESIADLDRAEAEMDAERPPEDDPNACP